MIPTKLRKWPAPCYLRISRVFDFTRDAIQAPLSAAPIPQFHITRGTIWDILPLPALSILPGSRPYGSGISTYRPTNLSFYQSMYTSTYLSRALSTYQSTDLSFYESTNLPINLPILSPLTYRFINLSANQPISLSSYRFSILSSYRPIDICFYRPPSIYNLPIDIELSIYWCVNIPTYHPINIDGFTNASAFRSISLPA